MKKAINRYEPPRDGVIFTKMWNAMLPQIRSKNNFNPDLHLKQLEILCTLYQEENELQDIVELAGRTYQSEGRNGVQIRPRPEVAQLNIVRNQIKGYTIMLGLGISKKDTKMHGTDSTPGGGPTSWD